MHNINHYIKQMAMANDGNYRETRWFTSYERDQTDEYYLSSETQLITGKTFSFHFKSIIFIWISYKGQKKVPFGNFIIKTRNTAIATETCEELFIPNSPHIELSKIKSKLIN